MKNLEIPKIEKLEVGQVIKNYKQLCEILKIKTKTGGSKITQLDKLQNFISYHKEGNKFIIDEIKSTGAVLIDKRSLGNNTSTSMEIGDIILHKLITEYRGKQINVTSTELLYRMMLTSKEYKLLLNDSEMYQYFTGIDFKYLNSFVLKVGYQLNRRVESALNRLKNSGYIMYDRKIYLKFKDVDEAEYIKTLESEEEKRVFIDSRLLAFRKLNNIRKKENKKIIPDMSVIFVYGEYKRFRYLVCDELNKFYDDKCINFWNFYSITTTELALKIVQDDIKYNKNIEYVKNEFYQLLERNTKEIKDNEILRLEQEFTNVILEEDTNILFGESPRYKSNQIKNVIYNLNNMNKNLIY